jgi:hypothetical protein
VSVSAVTDAGSSGSGHLGPLPDNAVVTVVERGLGAV